jgi:hypothetical protein
MNKKPYIYFFAQYLIFTFVIIYILTVFFNLGDIKFRGSYELYYPMWLIFYMPNIITLTIASYWAKNKLLFLNIGLYVTLILMSVSFILDTNIHFLVAQILFIIVYSLIYIKIFNKKNNYII